MPPAFAAAALPNAPKLGILFVAAQLVDIAFFIFLPGGIESMWITAGMTAMNGFDLHHMPYTHSLLGGMIWSGSFAAAIWVLTRSRTAALVAGAVIVSHWFIDLLVHRPDLTLAGSPPPIGLGHWNYPLIEMPLELGLVGASLGFYLGRTKQIAGATTHWPWTLGAVMLLAQLYNWLVPEPEALDVSLPFSALFAFGLFIWLAHKVGQTRTLKGAGEI